MKMEGIITAIVTPFDAKGEVDYDAFGRLIEHQIAHGVHGFVPCGSTGEYYAMTAEERAAVLKFVKDTVDGRATLIAGTNGGSTREVIDHTQTARNLGYEAVLLAPPYYSLPSQEELIAHFRAVIDAVDVKLVLYNYPTRVGVEIGFPVLDAFRDDERVIAIKESSGELLRAIQINERYGKDYQFSCGSDDQAFDFFMWGATSWICGPANCFVDQCVAFYNAFAAGDLARAQNETRRLFPAMASLETGSFVQKVKYGCELLGLPTGSTRQPLLPLSDAEKRDFKAAFDAAYATPSGSVEAA